MKRAVVQFPPGEILDTQGFVWTTLPPGTSIAGARILGTSAIDPTSLVIAQVTVERLNRRVELISPGKPVPFPVSRAFEIPTVESKDLRAESTTEAPVRVTVQVRRTSGGAERDARGYLLKLPEPAAFQLSLLMESESA